MRIPGYYPVLPPKEYNEAKVVAILSAIHSVSNPVVPGISDSEILTDSDSDSDFFCR